jgi:virulence factor Mce-like protein
VRLVNSAAGGRWAAVVGLGAVLAVVVYSTLGSGNSHRVRVAFDEALNIPNGALVQAAGVNVGTVASVGYVDGQAIVALDLNDEVWPLPRGTTAAIRLASVSGNVNRRIELLLGQRGSSGVPADGIIGASPAGPVELDDVLQAFDAPTRRNFGGTLHNISGALDGHTGTLNAGVHQLAPTLDAVGGLMTDLSANQQQLSSLLTRGDAVTRVLARHRQQVGDMVQLAGATFDTFARRSVQLQQTLDTLPPALTQVSHTTARLQPTLKLVTGLLTDLAPGAAQLQPLAAIATPTLTELRVTAGQGVQLAHDAITAAPDITRLLTRGTPFVGQVAPIVKRATPIVHCLRPYTPEAAGLLSNWASWNQGYDGTSHIGKIFVNASGSSFFDTPKLNSSVFKTLGLGYALLRPPGYLGNKPQFMPECGLTPAGLDPAKDWDR